MVVVLLMVLFMAILGLGMWAYAHSLLTNAAGQAVRYAANADVTDPTAVSQRAADIMSETLLGSAAATVECTAPGLLADGTVEVHCTMAAPLPLPLLSNVLPSVDVTAHALKEAP